MNTDFLYFQVSASNYVFQLHLCLPNTLSVSNKKTTHCHSFSHTHHFIHFVRSSRWCSACWSVRSFSRTSRQYVRPEYLLSFKGFIKAVRQSGHLQFTAVQNIEVWPHFPWLPHILWLRRHISSLYSSVLFIYRFTCNNSLQLFYILTCLFRTFLNLCNKFLQLPFKCLLEAN